MSGSCNVYLIRDQDREPGEPPELIGLIQEQPTPRDEMMFLDGGFDPELGRLVYPVIPPEWEYFALNQNLDTARFLQWQGLEGAPFVLYLGFPLDE